MDPVGSVSASPPPQAVPPQNDVSSLVHTGKLEDVVAAAKAHPDEARALYDGLVSANRYSDARSLADAVPGANTSGGFVHRSVSEMGAAVQHPDQGVMGAGKGILNTLSDLGTAVLRGYAMQGAGMQYQAAGQQALFGQTEAAKRSQATGDKILQGVPQMRLPTLPFHTPAEAGGDKIATTAMTVADGVGLVKGAVGGLARLGAKAAVEDGGAAARALPKAVEAGTAPVAGSAAAPRQAASVAESTPTQGRIAADATKAAGAASTTAAPARVQLKTFDDYRKVASGTPQPNTIYEFNGREFQTDGLGRTISSRGRIDTGNPGQRLPSVDRAIGNGAHAKPGDVGFHLGADILGFPGGKLNVVPGNGVRLPSEFPGLKNLNGSAYKKLETQLRGLADTPGNSVTADFRAVYNKGNATGRPDSFAVTYRVNNGPPTTRTFLNQPGG